MKPIKSAKDVYDIVKGKFLNKDVEHCYALTVGLAGNPIALHWVSFGSETACVIPKKVIARHAINDLASGVVLIHNHPSGDPTPSNADINETKSLQEMLDVLDIKLLDHLIIGEKKVFAFSEDKGFKVK